MNQDPIGQILWHIVWFVAAWLGVMLLLVGLCQLLKKYSRRFDNLERQMTAEIGPHALVVGVNVGMTIGLFLVSGICSLLAHAFGWQNLTKFGESCYFFAVLSGAGFAWMLKRKLQADEENKFKQALFGPRTMVKFGDVSGSAVVVGNSGAVHQMVHVDSLTLTLHKQIHSLIEAVPESAKELTEPQKRAAIDNLNVLADQAMRPTAQRERSKVEAALKLLPGILSSAAALAKAWEALEPLIRAHFQ